MFALALVTLALSGALSLTTATPARRAPALEVALTGESLCTSLPLTQRH